MKLKKSMIIGGLLLVIGATAALAAGKIDVTLEQKKIIMVDGKEKAIESADVTPGDLIEYIATYRNSGDQIVTRAEGEVPIPAGMIYIEKSASPANVMATTDGQTYAAVPLKRKVFSNGKEETGDVPLKEYRSLRWPLGDIPVGQQIVVKARMQFAP